jgi:hypothetical protein
MSLQTIEAAADNTPLLYRSSSNAMQLPDGRESWIVMFKKVLQQLSNSAVAQFVSPQD